MTRTSWYLFKSIVVLLLVGNWATAQDVNEAYEKAMIAAAKKAAPFIAKIETSGGRDVIGGGPGGGVRKGVGPTTGLVVDADGYVISSAFNFANKPTDIFVTVPGQPRLVAKIVASDTTRMLTLLKIDAKNLKVPPAYPKKDIVVGQTTLALGRALDPELGETPSISDGIISALGRIYGKCVQTDAKVSPVNYGGPLVSLDGRVIGVLVPASPRGETDTAGVEWYDSGIGFAVPLEDVYAVLPKLKAGKDLRRGLLGVTPKEAGELYNLPATIGTVSVDSAAAKAGLKPGDTIIKFDGKPVPHFSALQHFLGPKYENDVISLVVKRGDKEVEFKNLSLSGAVTAFVPSFLGILPMRDDPEAGVEIRYVYPKSAAEAAGLKIGDRLLKLAPANLPGAPKGFAPPLAPIVSRAQLTQFFTGFAADADIKFEVKRKEGGKTETLTIKLGSLPGDLLAEKIPVPSSAKRALEKPKAAPGPKVIDKKEAPKKEAPKKEEAKPEPKEGEEEKLGLMKRTNATLGREYWVYVPTNYDKNISYGVIVWLHAAGKGGKDADDVVKIWRDFCEDHHFIIIGPKSKNNEGWTPSETEEILQDIRLVMGQYTTDPTRVVAHGMGIGGQMAIYMGFNARDTVRGVAVTGATLGTSPKETTPNQPLSFFLIAGAKDPLLKDIVDGKTKLQEKKFPVIYREIADFGKEYLDEKSFGELRLWLDSLDRI
jgi:serine protease Do